MIARTKPDLILTTIFRATTIAATVIILLRCGGKTVQICSSFKAALKVYILFIDAIVTVKVPLVFK